MTPPIISTFFLLSHREDGSHPDVLAVLLFGFLTALCESSRRTDSILLFAFAELIVDERSNRVEAGLFIFTIGL